MTMNASRSLLLLALALPACTGELRQENDALKARLAERDAEIARLTSDRQAAADASATVQKRAEALQADLEAARRRQAELEPRAKAADAARDELRQSKTALETLRRELDQLQAEIETLTKEIQRLGAASPKPANP
jgi:chromosome segregation ATPase